MQQPKQVPNSVFKFVWHYLKPHKLVQVGFFVVALFWAVELTLTPYLLKRIIDAAAQYHGHQMVVNILWPCILYAAMSLWMNVNFRLFDFIVLRYYPVLKAKIGQDMFDYLMFHSYNFFQNNFAGTLTKKIFDMCTNVEKIIEIFNVWFYPRIFSLLIAAVTVAIVVKPIFGVALFLWTLSYMVVSFFGAKWIEQTAHQLSVTRASMSGVISDSISNIILTKLFSNMTYESDRVSQSIAETVYWDRRVGWKQLLLNFIQGIMVTILVAVMLYLLVQSSLTGAILAGDFAFVLTLSMFISMTVWQLGTQMLEFSKAVGECRQALSYMIEPHAIKDVADAKPLHVVNGGITFSHVDFGYESNQPLFNDLNVDIKPGQKVGLVGHSGGGKSTFINLILRLMDVQQGKVLVDGQDIKQVQKKSLREQIASIPQDTELFHRSILDNIRFARPDATDEEVTAAAKHAQCHAFILALPQGYESLVGERGVKLSGGQKQRIAIARAFLKAAPIILLDEATSALDSETEKLIQAGLHNIMQGRTAIAIAHRLSTLKDMDRILVFDNGRIVQDGTLNELIADKAGVFYSLWQMQSQGFLQ
ncbi:MAG: ABC transporter ATP-binding protein [Coxiellaceae bacterium]|nr:ABC transporter ATP-binding protein [Coxiellaceae bacterium]